MVNPYRIDPAQGEPRPGWRVRLRRWWRAWVSWPPGPSPEDYLWLQKVHERRFAACPYDRFVTLWCALATVFETTPAGLDEDQRIDELLARSRRLSDCLEDLRAFVRAHTADAMQLPPAATVGTLLDAMLPHLAPPSPSPPAR